MRRTRRPELEKTVGLRVGSMRYADRSARQGRGSPPRTYRCSSSLRSHSPSAPPRTFGARTPLLRSVVPPMAINDRRHGGSSSTEGAQAPTVHCMRRCPRKKVVPGTSRVRHQPHQSKDEDQNRVSTSPKTGSGMPAPSPVPKPVNSDTHRIGAYIAFWRLLTCACTC